MKSFDVFFKTIVDVKNFVNIVNKYDFDIDLESGRYVIDAKSIMGIFSLNLAQPIKIYIHSNNTEIIEKELEQFKYLP